MAELFGRCIAGIVEGVVRWLVMPVTSVIPRLVSSGILFGFFALLWGVGGATLLVDPTGLGSVWQRLGEQLLPIQAVAWLLFLPPMAGLWVLHTDWPLAVRLIVVAGLCAWNLLVLLPRRGGPSEQPAVGGV